MHYYRSPKTGAEYEVLRQDHWEEIREYVDENGKERKIVYIKNKVLLRTTHLGPQHVNGYVSKKDILRPNLGHVFQLDQHEIDRMEDSGSLERCEDIARLSNKEVI